MRVSTAIDRQTAYVTAARDVFSAARHFHSSHATIMDRLQERIYGQERYQKLPGYVKAYIHGVVDQMYFENIRLLEWRLNYHGEYVKSDDMRREDGTYPEDFWTTVSKAEPTGKHFWKGTDRVYY